jgi:hypothetical protein
MLVSIGVHWLCKIILGRCASGLLNFSEVLWNYDCFELDWLLKIATVVWVSNMLAEAHCIVTFKSKFMSL